jgi:excisionase family DNA binding protein
LCSSRLLTGRQVADMLGVSNKTVLRWALEGELPSIRLSNRAIRFRGDQLEGWLEQRAAPARPAAPPGEARGLSSCVPPATARSTDRWPDP